MTSEYVLLGFKTTKTNRMMDKKIKLNLGPVQETLLLPLWGRAVESKKEKPKLTDEKAVEIVDHLEYDFSHFAKNMSWVSRLAWVARSQHIDTAINNYVKVHPTATIINVGCGLDTTFERIDNGRIRYYELDLPDVIELRKHFFADSERRTSISCSIHDTHWFQNIEDKQDVLWIAAGVFYYFTEQQIKDFILSVIGSFQGGEFVFDAASPLGVRVANKKVIHNGGMDATAVLKWGIETAKTMERWDKRIKLLEEFPMFRGFKKGYSLKEKYGLWMSDVLKIMSMVHLKLEK
jgi:O-methyltransferase involved in polyketide biosynthesis